MERIDKIGGAFQILFKADKFEDSRASGSREWL
jgi:hypothetical protein